MTSHSGLIFEPWEKYVVNWHEKQIGALSKWSQEESKIKSEWLKQDGNNDGSGTNQQGSEQALFPWGGITTGRMQNAKQPVSRKVPNFPST